MVNYYYRPFMEPTDNGLSQQYNLDNRTPADYDYAAAYAELPVEPATSSNVDHYAYDDVNMVMFIAFRDGGKDASSSVLYGYPNIPLGFFNEFDSGNTDSKGGFAYHRIKFPGVPYAFKQKGYPLLGTYRAMATAADIRALAKSIVQKYGRKR